MTQEEWDEALKPPAEDPEVLRVYSDWLEDNDREEVERLSPRLVALFWEWVAASGLKPHPYASSCFGTTWRWVAIDYDPQDPDYGSQVGDDAVTKSCRLSRRFFNHLPIDAWADLAPDNDVMGYNSEQEAYHALFQSWTVAWTLRFFCEADDAT